MTLATETRASFEVRAVPGRKLQGYAAIFDQEARIGSFREIIRSSAFSKSLASNKDILLLADHDPAKVLARSGAGNLVLGTDARGLHFEATLPDTTAARDTWNLVESRTAGGCSFGFRVPVGGDRWTGTDLRELIEVALIEVSVVSAFPAYSGTAVAARSASLAGMSVNRLRRYLEVL